MTATLRDSPRAPSWHGAACRGHDPELWFPNEAGGADGSGARATAAKAICGRCPLAGACARYAIEIPDLVGVWGGLSSAERRRIRDRRSPSSSVCRCGCVPAEHKRRWRPGSKRGSCSSCDCSEYAEVEGG